MESFELNKIAGAILGALLFVMGASVISNGLIASPIPKVPGYDLPSAPPPGQAAVSAAPDVPLPILLAKADVGKGMNDTKACQACHNFEKGAAAKIGPPLYGVVERAKGSIAGFAYSEAMKAKGGAWTYDDLNAFIANPKGYVAGTKMAYAGEKDPAKRADIIDYLHTLAESPLPLPAP